MIVHSPLSEKDARDLKLGETVSLSGDIITGRDKMHLRAMSSDDKATERIRNATVFHCGPIISGSREVIAAGPTTSARMNSVTPEFIRKFKVRAIIGKGGMSQEVCDAMKEVGCVYLAATGGAAVSLAEGLVITGAEWEDLGMAEAMWLMKANNLGPLIVAMDSNGNSLYENVRRSLVV
jgi:hydro-lyases, Fe-S type, tartrate/fumarate subfamily, beta region